MGISWSGNRRRNNNYHQRPHQHPPHPQLVSSSYFYTSEPPPASNLPPSLNPPPQNYVFPTNTPYPPPPPPPPPPPSAYTPHNIYPTHPHPHPPPQPIYSSYYCSNGYNSCNYANPMMGQAANYPPYYANQTNVWPAVRPPVVPALPPLPYVEHQNAKKVRNDVNVHKDTLRILVDEQNPDHHLVSFEFDALFDGSYGVCRRQLDREE